MNTIPPYKVDPPETKITVAGVTFGAKEVKSAVLTIDGRDIQIGEKSDEPRSLGFR